MIPAAWRTPAVIIATGCLFSLMSFGFRTGLGLFLEPMSEARGWGREVFAFAMAVQNIVWGIGVPLAGIVADKVGAGRVLAAGAVLYALGIMLMPFAATPVMLYLTAGAMVGAGLAAASFGIVLSVISRAAPPEKRSLALGLGTAAGSAGQFLLAPVEQLLLAAYGWSDALVIIGVMVLAMLPLALVLSGRPAPAGGPQQSLGEALREAGRHGSYWYLIAGFFVCGFHVAFILTHLPPYLTDLGIPAAVAGWSLALVGLFNIVGSISAGILGGRRSKKWLLSGIYFARAVVLAVFLMVPPSATSVLVFAGTMGLLWLSTVPLTSGLVAQIFGPRYMATLFGIVFFSHQVGAFLGVWLGGRIYDATGSYDLVWWVSIALGLFAAAIHLPIDERRVVRPAAPAAA